MISRNKSFGVENISNGSPATEHLLHDKLLHVLHCLISANICKIIGFVTNTNANFTERLFGAWLPSDAKYGHKNDCLNTVEFWWFLFLEWLLATDSKKQRIIFSLSPLSLTYSQVDTKIKLVIIFTRFYYSFFIP